MPKALVGLLLLVSALAGQANDAVICREEQDVIQALELRNDRLANRVTSLRALERGEMIGGSALAELTGSPLVNSASLKRRRDSFADEKRRQPGFDEPLCEKTAQQHLRLQQTYLRLDNEYRRMMAQLLSLPDDNLMALASLENTHQQLRRAHDTFTQALAAEPDADVLAGAANSAVESLNNQLQKLFAAFLFLEPPSINTLTPHSDVMSLELDLPPAPPALADNREQFQDALYRARIALTHARTRLHHQVWSDMSLLTLLAPSSIQQLPELLMREVRLLVWHFQETLLESRLNIKSNLWARDQSIWLLAALSALAGILLILLLVFLAKRVEYLIYWAHDRLVEPIRQYRWMVRIFSQLNTLAPLAPWVLLLASLSWLAELLTRNQWYALLWILPLLQLVILFGLLALILEWLVFRIASTAGSFLNPEHSHALQTDARREALLIVIPWSAAFFIDKALGSSLMFRLVELAALAATWWRLGVLLEKRRADYISNTEQALARELNPPLKTWLQGKGFVVVAPLLLPIQVGFFGINFFDRTFRDFDWYRRLSARWFWLRTRYQMEQQEQDTPSHLLSEDYRQWFIGWEMNGKELPVIETGLASAISKPIDQWMDDHVNENTLMVIGEKGIGKSVALKRVARRLSEKHGDLRIISHQVPGKVTDAAGVRQLIGQLLDAELDADCEALLALDGTIPPTLIMLDECQNLFLGKVGGLEAWKALLDITNTRLNNIFWLFSMNNHSWAYLGNVFGRQYQMRQVVRARRWSQNEIRSLILSRTHLSGYRIRYDDILLNTYGSHQQNAGRSAEQRFFSLLWDSCRGIPLVALMLWLSAIRTQRKEVLVGLPNLPDMDSLDSIGNDLLFVYRAIVTHENLTHSQMVMVTGQSDNVVRYAIKLGLDIGFIEADAEYTYRIAPLWYHTLVNFLTRKNMIHE